MARKNKRGAAYGKRRGSQSQQVQNDRARRQTLMYSGIGLAALLGLCFIIWLVFRTPDTATDDVVDDTVGETETESGTDTSDTSDPVAAASGTYAGDFDLLEADRTLVDQAPVDRLNAYDNVPEMMIDTDKTYEAVITTANGEMRIRLFDDLAPLTVNNFVALAQDGFYDGTVFHRVIDNFMAQAGDPTGTGTGGPGYRFPDEVENDLSFDRRGLLAMANSGPGTNGSQFFITFTETPWLTGNHTIFGVLVDGDDTLGAITIREPGSGVAADVLERVDIYVSE